MDEKVFELIEKMYSEMQEGFKEVKQDIVRLEDKIDINHKALYDGYKQTYHKGTMYHPTFVE